MKWAENPFLESHSCYVKINRRAKNNFVMLGFLCLKTVNQSFILRKRKEYLQNNKSIKIVVSTEKKMVI